MDFRTFARTVLGRQPGMMVGRDISETEHEADKKAYDYYVKKGLDQAMSPEQLTSVSGGSFTNAEGRVTDYLVKPKGVDVQVLEPRMLTTPKGTYTMQSPTNAVPVMLPDGSIAQNYTSQTLLGEDEAALGTYSPGQTAAPAQTPAPTPMPSTAPSPTPNQQAPQQAQFVRVVSPDGKTGIIPAGQVDQAIKQGFRLAP
jgi:hypothetical protein